MIQANELRIGNWVIDGYYGTPVRVTAEIILAIQRENVPYLPIPLTEEILLNAGFEKKSNSDETIHDFYIGHNRITNDWLFKITKIDWGSGSAIFYRNGGHPVKYVHQLQNLYFALTGKELNIEP